MTVSVSHRRRSSWLQPTRLCAALLLATALAHSFAVLAAAQKRTPSPPRTGKAASLPVPRPPPVVTASRSPTVKRSLTPPPPTVLEPYSSYDNGDEVLVLSVQRDPRVAATDAGDAEQRLFFTVDRNGNGDAVDPDGPPPTTAYRRIAINGGVTADAVASLETGDAIFLSGSQRVPSATLRPSSSVTAAGLSMSSPDPEPDSDFIAAESVDLLSSSFNRYMRSLSFQVPTPRRVTSVTFILNVCSKTNPIKPQELQPYWDGSATDGPTLRHFFTECSNRQESFSPETNLIVGPIDVPCSATTSNGRPYNSKRCTDREVFGWAQYAIDYVQENSPDVARALTRAERRIFLLPDLAPCAEWESLASVGCSNDCPIFLKTTPGATARSVASQLIHDLGHSYSLSHSAAREQVLPAGLGGAGGTRADASCPMGNASRPQALVCPNAPNSWKNGWVTLLNGSNRFNITGFFNDVVRLPATNVRYDSVVRVNVVSANKLAADPTNKANSVYYISYRRSAAAGNGSLYDTGLASELNGQVYVHQYDGQSARTGTPYKPLLVGASTSLDASKRIKLSQWVGSYFAVRLIDADASTATVRICSASGPRGLPASENALGCIACMDGLDNDCNGLVDEEDPACKACTAGGRRAAV